MQGIHTHGKWKRIILVFLALLIAFSGVGALAQLATPPAGSAPVVTVAAVGIADGYLELGLSLDSKDNEFQAVGSVLEFDPELLIPVYWVDAGDDGIASVDLDGAEDWETTVALPTKGPDYLSGKTALCFVDDDIAYLYLSAEAPKIMDVERSDNYPEIDPVETFGDDPEWGIPDEDELPITAPIEQAVTVRFYIDGWDEAGEEDRLTLQEAAVATIKVVSGPVAKESPMGDEDGVTWLAGTFGIDTPSVLEYLYIEEGKSVNQGGGGEPGEAPDVDLSNVAVLVFYDWDETFLGATAIDKNASAGAVAEAIEAFHADLYEGYDIGTTDLSLIGTGDPEVYDGAHPEKPLTYKKGYNFIGWTDVLASELESAFTSYDTRPEADAEMFDPADSPPPAWGNIILKAAYVKDDKCDTFDTSGGADNATRTYYTYTDISYERIGTSTSDTQGNYAMTFLVKRQNLDNIGVSRLREPLLRLVYTIGTVTMYASTSIKNTDTTEVTLVIPKAATSFQLTIVDNYGVATYTTANPRSTVYTLNNKSTTANLPGTGDGYVVEATLKVVNPLLLQNVASLKPATGAAFTTAYNSTISAQFMSDIGYSLGSLNVNQSAHKITLYCVAMGSVPLTAAQINTAINMTVTGVPTTVVGASITTMHNFVVYVQDALDLKRGAQGPSAVLTPAEIEYAVTSLGGWV